MYIKGLGLDRDTKGSRGHSTSSTDLSTGVRPVPVRGPVWVWALARMGHGGLLAVLQGSASAWPLNSVTERPVFNSPKSANPTPA